MKNSFPRTIEMDDVKSITSPIVHTRDGSMPGTPDLKRKHEAGITLIPRPSDDPRDPLNWPMRKKVGIVAVLCLAVFAGFTAPLAGQLNVKSQAALYKVSTVQIAWQNSAASAGLAVGGFFFAPISHRLGRSSIIFWTLVFCLLTQIWAAKMISPHQFNGFITSRFFSGLFGGVTGVLGPRILVDLFFLHQRGRAFTAFHWCLNLGSVAGPTISALISANRSWTLEFWWTVGLLGLTIVGVFLFMHETSWVREDGAVHVQVPEGFFANRVATFFPGNKITPTSTWRETRKVAEIPFQVAASPVMLILSFFTLISFGFYIAMNAVTPVFLQKPEKLGGYGFTTIENAYFSFVHWIGIIIALVYGHFVSDRLPLYLASSRNNGVWTLEYRLHALWIPSLIFNPIGLGVFGAALEYHLSWVVVAVGQVFVTFGSLSMIPITVNYICESFVKHPAEASITGNCLRLLFGLSVAFYINEWIADVNVGWTYGTMAFFEVFSFGAVGLLMWKGHVIRSWTVGGLNDTEEGEKVIETKSSGSDV